MSGESVVERDLELEDEVELTVGEPSTGAKRAESAGAAPQGGAQALTGLKKAAVFILSLEEEVASLLLRCLSDDELGKITAEIPHLGVVDKDAVSNVFREFSKLRALAAGRSPRVAEPSAADRSSSPFGFLESVEPEALLACLGDEHPQTLAVILAHMSPARAAAQLERLQPDERRDLLERIARLEGTSTEALESLASSLRKQLDAARFESYGDAAGLKAAAGILRAANGGGGRLFEDLKQGRPELAEEIGKHLFTFEELLHLEDSALQLVLKEVDVHSLAHALKKAPPRLEEHVLNNLSRRAAEELREEIGQLGALRLTEIEAARRSIVETVLRLEAAGEIYLSARGREENRLVY